MVQNDNVMFQNDNVMFQNDNVTSFGQGPGQYSIPDTKLFLFFLSYNSSNSERLPKCIK